MTGQAAESLGPGVPAVGELIAQKYRVESVVGRGGMGVVVSARHVQLGQTVAIKLLTLPPDEERRDEAIARFLHEAQAAAKLQNDHVVRIYDVGQLESGLPFMVMELLSGSDLGSLLDDRGPLPEAEAVDYVLQACAGVSEAHQMGIVHRDLKPSNLFVTRRSDGLPLIKVLDFGISKQLTDPSSGEALPTFTNTRTLMGSPNYMSPEQVRDARRVDARTDVWAMGIILQELMTNAPVFHGESFPGVCAAIVADSPMPVRTLRPDVSDRLEAIINRCLEKDVRRRYQSIAELAAELSPLGSRARSSSSGPHALVYSGQARVSTPQLRSDSRPSASEIEQTVSMPPRLEPGRPAPDGTLESARLNTLGGTHKAVSAPSSHIEIVSSPAASGRGRSQARWLVPLGAALVLTLGVFWLQRQAGAPAALASAAPLPSAAPSAGADATFTLSIDSEPPGASVSEGSVRLGSTPFSLSLSLPEGSSPRVFVIEKEGFQPYVVRQGAAHGQVRVVAALSPKAEPAATAVAPPPTTPAPIAAKSLKPKSAAPAPKRPAVPSARPPSDIRLER